MDESAWAKVRADERAPASLRAARAVLASADPWDAAAIEQLGLLPRLVLGSRENLKVTYREDLAIAEAILATRK